MPAYFFLEILEGMLNQNRYLLSDKVSFVDIALFPFIRQFARVDMDFFAYNLAGFRSGC